MQSSLGPIKFPHLSRDSVLKSETLLRIQQNAQFIVSSEKKRERICCLIACRHDQRKIMLKSPSIKLTLVCYSHIMDYLKIW